MRLARAVFSDLAWDRVYRNIRIYLNRIMTLYLRLFVRNLVFIGAAVVILLFAALIIRAIRIAMNAPDTYGSLVAVGIAAQLAIQTILNIAVATSSVPNTGVALPFFSYGGTAIITLLCEMGVLLNISRHSVKD